MKAFKEPFLELSEFSELKKELKSSTNAYELSGCIEAVRPAIINAIAERKTVVIARDDVRARDLYNSYLAYSDDGAIFPAKDILFYQSDIQGNALIKERMKAINDILSDKKSTVFLSVEGLINCLPPGETFSDSSLTAEVGDVIDLNNWTKTLVSFGFENVTRVEHPGEFASRGGILDVYPLTAEAPYRIELFGDEVDSIRTFSPGSQMSVDKIDSVRIDPATEMVLSPADIEEGIKRLSADADKLYTKLREEFKTEEAGRIIKIKDRITDEIDMGFGLNEMEAYMPYFTEKLYSILDFFPSDSLVILDDARGFEDEIRIREEQFRESLMRRLEKGYILPGQLKMIKSTDEILPSFRRFKKLILSTLDTKIRGIKTEKSFYIKAVSVTNYGGSFEQFTSDLKKYKKNGKKVVIVSSSRTKAKKLSEDIRDFDLNSYYTEKEETKAQSGGVLVTVGEVEKGFELSESGFVLFSENDIFGNGVKRKRKRKKRFDGEKFNSLSDLNVGDYVVHENHGVGIYKGLEKVDVSGVTKDYLKIEYAGKSNLFILASSLDMIQKYGGSEGAKPKLNSLGNATWSKTKKNVERSVGEVAKELVELYSLRSHKEGFVYTEDTVWQKEFEEDFPYEETEGQLEAIEAVKKDMESTKIMDRLICGDVGYGKTEIALRAAFKAVQDNKQVVMLCPTTVLAQQHYNTFVERMKNYPITIELLSRFRSAKEQKIAIEGLKSGKVDILIGTHRALSDDVHYKDLGLLVIDEEQRFGVRHKEKIKALKNNVDVMCLSATPIPRTLHMSLIGIRDMSVLEEAPMDRMPIQTFVCEYNDEMVRDAILREINRGGQVYYVYNRVNSIADMAAAIKNLIPEANVAYAHGKMSEAKLEGIMSDFIDGEIDVLIATTIIEIGLDIPNVNTMIIHDSERLGLSQLYQLRGRIGRSNRLAYAFFMYKKDRILKEVAEKRLGAIKEFSDLGSGYKIALRDLEIRGAGNLLGKEQSGHMEAVGYDLYCKMLNNAVRIEKGEVETMTENVEVDINIDAYIPASYINDEVEKLDIYKRIAEIRNDNDYELIRDEMVDRFGEMPRSVENLLYITKLKNSASSSYVTKISEKDNVIKIRMYNKAKLDPTKIPALIEEFYPYITFSANPGEPEFVYNTKTYSKDYDKNVYEYLLFFLEELYNIRDNVEPAKR